MKSLIIFTILIILVSCNTRSPNSLTKKAITSKPKLFVFVAEKNFVSEVKQKDEEVLFDKEYTANYKVIKNIYGQLDSENITFTVFDHYGVPPFSHYKTVLLYVCLIEGKYYHEKYLYNQVYETINGKWAGEYAFKDYKHEYNKDTKIKPVQISFLKPIKINLSGYDEEIIERVYPKPYYDIKGNEAIVIYGNYAEELFKLKKGGVLKARGYF